MQQRQSPLPFPVPHPQPLAPSAERGASRKRVTAGGRFLLSGDASEHRCQTVDVSASGIALRASVNVRLGERVICYLDEVGRVEGRVTRLIEGGFALDIDAPPAKRARLAERLASQAARHNIGDPEARRHERIEPVQTRVVLRTPEGRHIAANIINLSRSGAALTCPLPPAVGAEIVLGRRPATVIRASQRLLAVQFVTPIEEAEFSVAIVL